MQPKSMMNIELFFSVLAVLLVLEIIVLIKKLLTLKILTRTKAQETDLIVTKRPGEIFECNGPLVSLDNSPITQTPSAWWAFNAAEVRVNHKGGAGTVPFNLKQSADTWIFVETPEHVLALSIQDYDRVERQISFSWTSVISDSMPAQLHNYMSSTVFDTSHQIPFGLLSSKVATTYYEQIIPAGVPVHVIGNVRILDHGERSQLIEKLRRLNIKKKLLNMTLSGDHFQIGMNNEYTLVKRLSRQIFLHSFIVVAGIFLICLVITNRKF